jgi:hypothetical protein
LTVASWTSRLDEAEPDALVQLREPVGRFPDFVGCLVRRLKALCPTTGSRRIASVLARAGLHLGATTVRRMLEPKPRVAPAVVRGIAPSVLTAKRPNYDWHLDLSAVPIGFAFWIPRLPLSLPQRWPFCWWIAVVVDHHSRTCECDAWLGSRNTLSSIGRSRVASTSSACSTRSATSNLCSVANVETFSLVVMDTSHSSGNSGTRVNLPLSH